MIDSLGALQLLGKRAWLSHETAARLLGIELVHDDGTQRITVPRNRSRVSLAGWVVVRSDVAPLDVEVRDQLRCTDARRTVADLARVLPHERAVVAADSALRLGLITVDDLTPLRSAWGRGADSIRQVAIAADPKAGSVLESLLRVALAEAGIPSPVTQYSVLDHGQEVGRVDFCWPSDRLIVEADGFAFHSTRDDYRRDRRRMNEYTRLGWTVLRFSWEDVVDRRDHVVGTVRACLTRQVA